MSDPYAGFPGRIGRTFSTSRPAWPDEPRPPADAPNIVVILVDDLGYSDIGCYGSEIATPHIDRLAAAGVQLTDYHTTPLCSPSRAALLTGINPHRAGFAYPANSDPGYPSYTFELPENAPTLAESLRDHGYATFMVGKWHLTGDRSQHDAAARRSWPLQRGFDRYFGSLEGFTSLHAPHRLVWDNSPYPVEDYGPDYYLTDDLTERAVGMIDGLRAHDADKPFLLYFAHHAVHGPVQARRSDLAAQRGAYADGWDVARGRRFARQVELGLFEPTTRLPPALTASGAAVPAWADLDADEQVRYARYMEAYAAAVTAVDDSVGAVMKALDRHGELENTIVVFTSDNGGTAEGGPSGTRSYFSQFAHVDGLPADWDRDVDRDLDLIGGPRTAVHYPSGWGAVSNTPFKLFKATTYAGGIRAPLVVHWPAGGLGTRSAGESPELRHQYVHVTDLTPTLLDLAGVPRNDQRHGLPAEAMDGVSAAEILRSAEAPIVHVGQYTETGGHRAYQTPEWKITTAHRPGAEFDHTEWRLYRLADDPTEIDDLAPGHPEVLAELAEAWEAEAWRNRVFPLDDHGPASGLRRRDDDHFGAAVRLFPMAGTLERYRSAQLIQHRDVEIEISFDARPTDHGVLLAHGDQGGGYLVVVEGQQVRLGLNAYGRMHHSDPVPVLPNGNRVVVGFTVLPEFRWRITLGNAPFDGGALPDRAVLDQVPQLLGMAPFTGISVGADRGGPVDWTAYARHGSHPWTGLLHSVIYRPGPLSADAPNQRARVWAEGAHIYD